MNKWFLILVPLLLVIFYLIVVIYNQFTYVLGFTTGEKIKREQMTNSALLVIDIQNSYPTKEQQAKSPELAEFIAKINQVSAIYQAKTENILYIAQVKKANTLRSFFMPHITVEGSKAAALNSSLKVVAGAKVFTKYQADTFSNPKFEEYLSEQKVGRLYLTGMAAEVCVHATIQGAVKRGYEVYVVKEAILAIFGAESKQKMFDKYQKLGAKLISLKEFEEGLSL